MTNKLCKQCNKMFSKPVNESQKNWISRHVYCSLVCYNLSKKGKPLKNIDYKKRICWNKGKKIGKSLRNTTLVKICVECGKDFLVKKYRSETASFCSKKCHYKFVDNGLTDINYRIRRGTEIRCWRNTIFCRDNYICQICGVRGCTLNAHHIKKFSDYPEMRFNESNGITLCNECHKLVNGNENQWESYFMFNLETQKLVAVGTQV